MTAGDRLRRLAAVPALAGVGVMVLGAAVALTALRGATVPPADAPGVPDGPEALAEPVSR
ncbi:hypothetical protein ACFY2R_09300 [Micromonospora olivasterospora]|uniref:Uncharacterized protein n=1 Tax=Micromonospora olivasterospora TaxID=1880 RepID=A0A562IEF6_MICOL|nr:hypothetical protein [Micromonospora olivasterospora]TWH69399.1 hypothetical protein JD77_04408 [Micromonospora olivasterospora]